MLATRCKLRWPGAVATVGSPCISLARPNVTAPSPQLTRTRARARCLGTTASPEGGRDGDEKEGDGSSRGRPPLRYSPRAYEPESMSYTEILRRAISEPVCRSSRVLRQLHRALQPGERFHEGETSVQPAKSSLPLEHVLDRSLSYLTFHSERIQSVLSAVSQDASSHLVPHGYANGLAAIRAHHLGRWYASAIGLGVERRRITDYLNKFAPTTEKARGFINFTYVKNVKRALHSHEAAVRQAIHQHQNEFGALVYAMVCELKAARLAGQWYKVWMLERKLASIARFLPKKSPASVLNKFANEDHAGMTEISMSRMAEWNDSYVSLYEEDVYTRERMDLIKRYWAIYNGEAHEKPWQKEPIIFAVKSPVSRGKEFIVLRQDQSSPPSPLWPRDWKPSVLTETKTTAESNPTTDT